MKIAEFSVKNSLLVNMISVFILFAGLIAMFQIRREAFPDVDFDIVTVTTVYPGAPAEDVEKFVTIPIEKELKGISGVKDLESTSDEGQSMIGITIDPEASDKAQVVADIKDAVDRVRDLPEGVKEDPVVFELKSKETPIIEISLSGDVEEDVVRKYAESLEDLLLDINGVASVKRIGWRDREYWVEVDPQKMNEWHVSFDEIIEALRRRNVTLPGGALRTTDLEYNVRITGEFKDAGEIAETVIRANDAGNWLRVRDVASVRETFEDATHIAKINKHRTLAMVVIKSEQSDAIRLVSSVEAVIERYKKDLPEGMDITTTNDMSYYIKRRLGVLTNNGIIGFILVLIMLFLFLDPIPALVTAMGLPVAVFSTFIVMLTNGMTINLVSMLGLIIVLGMLVDDGIIVAENVYRYVEEGMDPREAAVRGTSEVIVPVTATVLTTVAAFAPLLFMPDIMGKFIKEVPLVVMIALGASLLEAFIILPSHLSDLLTLSQSRRKGTSKATPRESGHKKGLAWLARGYTRCLNWALGHRYLFALLLTLTLGLALFIFNTRMKVVLFSNEDVEQVFIRAEAPKGTPLEKMNELIKPVEELVSRLPTDEVEAYRTYLGSIETERGFDPNARIGTHLGQITVFLTPFQDRKRSPKEISDELRDQLEDIKGFDKLYMYVPKIGPPVGRAVSVGIKGEKFETLQEIAQKFMSRLKTIPGVSDVELSYSFGKKQLKVEVDEDMAKKYYLNLADIAAAVRSAFKGTVATSIKPAKAENEIDVVVRFKEDIRDSKKAFEQIVVENKFGNLVPLPGVARVIEEDGVYQINHLDGKRVIYVLANVDDEVITSLEVNKILQKEFLNVANDYLGYSVKYTGEFEQQLESQRNLLISFSFALFIIFIILTAMFNSLIQPFIVMLAIPFGLVGVIFSFYLHGIPIGFFALMGIVGLSGIVVNDSIVLVDFINRNRKQGMPRRQSLLEAGRLRLRPVMMTTLTTVGGLVSVAYGIGGGDPFLKPMALAIVWGLAFSTILTLFLVPCIYAIVDDLSNKILHCGTVKINGKIARRDG